MTEPAAPHDGTAAERAPLTIGATLLEAAPARVVVRSFLNKRERDAVRAAFGYAAVHRAAALRTSVFDWMCAVEQWQAARRVAARARVAAVVKQRWALAAADAVAAAWAGGVTRILLDEIDCGRVATSRRPESLELPPVQLPPVAWPHDAYAEDNAAAFDELLERWNTGTTRGEHTGTLGDALLPDWPRRDLQLWRVLRLLEAAAGTVKLRLYKCAVSAAGVHTTLRGTLHIGRQWWFDPESLQCLDAFILPAPVWPGFAP
jgi:hypothetical protein